MKYFYRVLFVAYIMSLPVAVCAQNNIKQRKLDKYEKAIQQIEEACKKYPIEQGDHLDEIYVEVRTALKVLEKSGSKGAQQILSNLNDPKKDWRIHYFMVITLKETKDKQALESLRKVLLSSNYHQKVRSQIPYTLGEYDTPGIKPILKEAALDPNMPKEVKRDVMAIIGALGVDDVEFLKLILQTPVENFNDMGIIFNALRALGKCKDPRATDILIDLMTSRYKKGSLGRAEIAEALALRKATAAVPAMCAIMLEDLDNRSNFAAALGEIGSLEAVDALLKVLEDPESQAYDIVPAARSLEKIGDRRAAPHLKKLLDNIYNDSRVKYDIGSRYDMVIPSLKKAYEILTK